MSGSVRVLIVDDSLLVRRALARDLARRPGIEIAGTAPDPYQARDLILQLKPDALTLDLEMPRMNGLAFLQKLMKYHPIPTVVVSSTTPRGCETALRCLEAGAIDVLCKPGEGTSLDDLCDRLAEILRGVRGVRLEPGPATAARPATAAPPPTPPAAPAVRPPASAVGRVIALGASTGGTEALRTVLERLPAAMPGVVITQHMPPGFTRSFAERLDRLSPLAVREAEDGMPIEPGHALLAPGDRHLRVVREGPRLVARVADGPRVCRHKPSVEVLFESVAQSVGSKAIGVIMTGMGGDGATGLKAMRDAGALTIAQDEASCVVFGMPREAILRGGAEVVAPLDEIAGRIVAWAASATARSAA